MKKDLLCYQVYIPQCSGLADDLRNWGWIYFTQTEAFKLRKIGFQIRWRG